VRPGFTGAGIDRAGGACISLGTSGVYLVANDRFLPALGGGMHTHRHAVNGLFVQNSCVLSAGAALAWAATLVGAADVAALLAEVEAAAIPIRETPVFTPYLAGERTPHNDPSLAACFSGLTLSTTRLHLVQAVLEGVALALGDCHQALLSTSAPIGAVTLVGGGARSGFWSRLIASAIGRPLKRSATAAVGPALGVARLARAGVGGPLIANGDGRADEIAPSREMTEQLARKRAAFEAHPGLPASG